MGQPILVTGAGGRTGGVGRAVVERLLRRGLPVRAFVRREDDRAAALRAIGADVVAGDLTIASDVMRALSGCRRMYFGMGIAANYLEATAMTAAVARELGLEVLVNMSQLTVSQMSLTAMTDSPQQRQHWLGEQVLNWSGLPVVHVRPTVFLQNPFFLDLAAASIARDGTIRLPFADGKTSPVDVDDIADVIVELLANPRQHVGKVYELTGPRSETLHELAAEYAAGLGRPVRYIAVPFERWRDELAGFGLSDHLLHHLLVMAQLHAQNRYDRLTHDIEKVTGHPATSARDFVARNALRFAAKRGDAHAEHPPH
jgi:NAD(P)H dehydrogenase (quinone)